jgi:hypothetical protein
MGGHLKKSILIVIIVAVSRIAHAGSDAMAIFWKNKETMVLINEAASEAKLKQFIEQVGKGESFNFVSNAGDISIQCKTVNGAASCTFKLKASSEVELGDSYTIANSDSSNTTSFRLNNLALASFENAKSEKFIVWIDQFQVVAGASK